MAEKLHGHQETDVTIRPIALFGVGLFAFVLLVAFSIHRFMAYVGRLPDTTAALRSPLSRDEMPPEPRLQTSPPAEMEALRNQEDAVLESFGWVDRQNGIARIPVAEAKKLLLAKGLPVRQP